ncbi:hypothetical protein Zm00014a_001069 [Zea mays]|uniref:Uncharacterized protein n=1 Tax=Zea mays TaxID=4577 RepID=A0A317Y6Z1_MAIZE|nr:hypothetical protein Zm00014a_001069 [Zea mays]
MASPPHSVEVRTPSDSPRPTAALLSPSVAAPQPSTASRLLLFLTVVVAAATAFVLLRPPITVVTAASALQARGAAHFLGRLLLRVPVQGPLPHIRRIFANGTSAAEGLIPVFPTLTFPNHYSIVTGLYPSSQASSTTTSPIPSRGTTSP